MSELWKAFWIGVLQGVTEWLPVSSTGHMLLLDRYLCLDGSPAFREMFFVVIQFGSILAVICLYAARLNPIAPHRTPDERKATLTLWGRVLIATLPAAIVGLLLDDLIEAHLYAPIPIAIALIAYGILYLRMEHLPSRTPLTVAPHAVGPRQALTVGCFQALALIPGTSRSGATILGGTIAGLDRKTAAEFSFYMAIPTMLGASTLKIAAYIVSGTDSITASEWGMLAVGSLTAFLVSLLVIRTLLDFVKRHSFAVFGVYRILLGLAVLLAAAVGRI